MDLQDCIKFANENPVCYLATTDGDQPRVRAFLIFFADESGFYFGLIATKQVSKQLKSNPKVEVCFYSNPPDLGDARMMRVAGQIEFLDDIPLKARILEERPFLKFLGIEKPEDPRIEICRIHTGEAHFWTMADNARESEIERIKF
jgi:pyridoxamine 5'-phosphate oxidase